MDMEGGLPPLVIPFPSAEFAEWAAASSLARETRGVYLAFRVAVERCPAHLRHTICRLINDNQGCIQVYQSMGGSSPIVFKTVRELWELAFENDIELQFEWRRRTDPAIQVADELSKKEDGTDFRLTTAAFKFICQQPLALAVQQHLQREIWGYPTLDVFAAEENSKVTLFLSKYLCPRSAGVDGFTLPWQQHHLTEPQQRPLVWAFYGPFSDPSQVIQKVLQEKVDTILVVPVEATAPWWPNLNLLPVRSQVVLHHTHGEGMLYVDGPTAPSKFSKFVFQKDLLALLVVF